jgi:hypothetical protein
LILPKPTLNWEEVSFKHSPSLAPYFTWGGFHFWGHAEFYIAIPFQQLNFNSTEDSNFELKHSVVTGARFLPWAYQAKKIRPYMGVSWSSLDFKQIINPDKDQPVLSKDFMLVPDVGVLYGYKDFTLRLGINYFFDNTWNYPISKTEMEEISTPQWNVNLGLRYAMDFSKKTDAKTIERWNSRPHLSKPRMDATKFGDFFVGIGPSLSFSLSKSAYNQSNFPYLKNKLTSSNYFDIAAGYHFNKAGLFAAVSFRNPHFETEGYGTKQSIQKTSFNLEVNKFLTDYSGFTPYIGLNVAYDDFKYTENENNTTTKELSFHKIEPGITLGWDILPGKTEEYLILRTNLRWYPFSSFTIDGKKFDFSQLEYNLIQVVFYPERLLKAKKTF